MTKENLFYSHNAPEVHIFNSRRHQKLLLVANQLQVNKNNSKDIGISKLVSQLKLLPNVFEHKGNGTVVLSTIIKKLQDMSRNRSLFLSEVGKIVRLLLLSQASNAESDGIFSALKCVKTYSCQLWEITDCTL